MEKVIIRRKRILNVLKLLGIVCIMLTVAGCYTTVNTVPMKSLDFTSFQRQKDDESIVFITPSKGRFTYTNLFVFTNQEDFSKIIEDLKKSSNRISNENQVPGIIMGTSGKYSPVAVADNAFGRGLVAFSLPNSETIPILIVKLAGTQVLSTFVYEYGWEIFSLNEDGKSFGTTMIVAEIGKSATAILKPMDILNTFKSCNGSYGYRFTSGKETQKGFIDLINN